MRVVKSKKSATVYGWTGEGNNVSEAKADAIKQIESAAEGYWSPAILCYRGLVGICWREPSGWSYTIARPSEGDGQVNHSSHGNGNKQDTINSMCSHLAQNAFNPGDSPEAPSIIVKEADRKDFETWARWQNHYRDYKTSHPLASPDECWHGACALQAQDNSINRAAALAS